ncbi:hypothetical protein AAVH_22607 [Aphelenchoides avenae]|nr:hypothetical protein AAVH_22607 [Aphelenchus avenae]
MGGGRFLAVFEHLEQMFAIVSPTKPYAYYHQPPHQQQWAAPNAAGAYQHAHLVVHEQPIYSAYTLQEEDPNLLYDEQLNPPNMAEEITVATTEHEEGANDREESTQGASEPQRKRSRKQELPSSKPRRQSMEGVKTTAKKREPELALRTSGMKKKTDVEQCEE